MSNPQSTFLVKSDSAKKFGAYLSKVIPVARMP